MGNAPESTIRKACYRGGFADDKILNIGTGNDVTMKWDGTDFHLGVAANNSVLNIGNGTLSADVKIFGSAAANYILWDASDNQIEFEGAARLNFTGADGAAGNSDGQIIAGGSTTTHLTTTVASSRWISLYTDCSATSGSSYCARFAHYVIGAGGSGAGVRAYGYAKGAAALAVYGVEATAEINAAASSDITGELAAGKFTSTVNLSTSGTVSVLNLTISTDTGKTMHGNSAFINVANAGAGADIRNLFYFADARGAAGAATIVNTDHANDLAANLYVKCRDATGDFWLMATSTAPAAS